MKKISNITSRIIINKWWVVLLIGMLMSFVLVLFMGKGQDVWFDEAYSIMLAQQPIPQLFGLTGVDAHPPLYYLLLKLWGGMFGWSELALRSLSALFAAATIGLAALLIRRLFSTKVALMTLPFLVIGPFWIRYGYEIRMYSVAGFICVLATLVLVKAVAAKNDWRWWSVYALLVALGMYTLYMTAVVWLAHVVWLLLSRRENPLRQPWVWALVGSVVLFSPYVTTLYYQLTHSALPGIGQRLNLTQLSDVTSQVLIYTVEWQIGSWQSVGILIIIGLVIYLMDRIKNRLSDKERKSLLLVMCLVLVPIIFFFVISLPPFNPIFIIRYIAPFVLFMYALIGIVAALGWHYGYRKASGTVMVLTLIFLAIGNIRLHELGNYNYDRMEHIETSTIRQSVDCKKSIIVADDEYTYINSQFYFADCDLKFYATRLPGYSGGYALLAGRDDVRLKSPGDADSAVLVHLYWNDIPQRFRPDSRYKLVSSVANSHQVTDTYELISE